MELVARGYGKESSAATLDDLGRRAAHAKWPGATRHGAPPLSNSLYARSGKRILDVVIASVALIGAAPLILFLMLLVWIDGGRPLFRHARVGRGYRLFDCLKIRSMRVGAQQELREILARDPVAAAEWAADQKLTNDPRVTRLGAFLRKSSLDELPQLFNVLRGDMSIVGPRPVTSEEVDRYGASAASYAAVRPGLTGPWQVSGRNDISFAERVALDVDYAREHSLAGDIVLIARTALSVLKLTGK